jgi:hypothetical protein
MMDWAWIIVGLIWLLVAVLTAELLFGPFGNTL